MGLKLAPMAAYDVLAILPMVRAQAKEEARPYPHQTPQDIDQMQGWLLDQIGRPEFGGFVVRDGWKAKGVMWGFIAHREFVHPTTYLDARFIYVLPSHRKRGVAVKLLTAFLTWGRGLLGPDAVMEGITMVGTPAHAMWLEAGWQPVYTRIAWVDPEGRPRPGVPLARPPRERDTPRVRREVS